MKKLLIATSLFAISIVGANAQITATVNEIAPYVFPHNKPATPPNFTYAPDGNGYLLLSDDHCTIDRYDMATGKKIETVFDVATTREGRIPAVDGFIMSDNGRYILVYTDSEPIYRRSFTASYYVYEVRTRLMHPLSSEFPRQQSPVFSPNGRMIAFVHDNNIYIKKLDYNSQVAVTKDGEKNVKINGVPDWVCEEEFSSNVSMVWSPDDTMLCYLSYDEEKVPMYTLPIYQGTCNPQDQYALYPGVYSYKYPVAGEHNSVVKLHSYDVETRKIKDLELPDKKIEYLPRIAFGATAEDLMVTALNRDQNHLEIYRVNPKSTIVKSVYSEDSKAWIVPATYEDFVCVSDGFMIRSTKSGYSQLYKYTYAGALARTVTSGNFDVTDFYGVDSKGNIYYQVASPTPLDRIVNKVDIKGKTTTISKTSGTTSMTFNPDLTMAMVKYSDAQTPPVYAIFNSDGKQLRVVEDNAQYAARTAKMAKKEFITVESDGYALNGYVLLPADRSKKYPVIMYQYSGPGSQQVLNSWELDWPQYFVTQGYAVVCVDGRGTGARGREFMDVVYRKLGHYETIDQINAAKWAASQPWADPDRIGIYGWSYGGYEALMCASAANSPYAAAVAIAPVTDWRFYDSVYTERYMLTPQQNESGYVASSPINKVKSLRCPLLIMYGTSDDNVHPANALQYVSTLQSNGGICDMMSFPNMNHSINGCNARAVVFAKMLQFFNTSLKR